MYSTELPPFLLSIVAKYFGLVDPEQKKTFCDWALSFSCPG